LTVIVSIRAAPVRTPSARRASKPGTSPRKVATAYGTSNATLEWTVSATYVPVGIDVSVLRVLIAGSFGFEILTTQ
jgi:hypothetical protein